MTILLFVAQRTAYNKPFLLFIALHLMIPYYGRLRQYEKKDTPHLCYLPQIKIARYTTLNEAYILIRLGNHYLMPFNNCFCTIYFFEPFLSFCIRPFRLLYCNRNNHRFDTFSSRGESDSVGCVPVGDFLFACGFIFLPYS